MATQTNLNKTQEDFLTTMNKLLQTINEKQYHEQIVEERTYENQKMLKRLETKIDIILKEHFQKKEDIR